MLWIVAWEDPEGRLPFSKFVSDFSMSKLIVVKVSRALNLRFTHCLTSPGASEQPQFLAGPDKVV